MNAFTRTGVLTQVTVNTFMMQIMIMIMLREDHLITLYFKVL